MMRGMASKDIFESKSESKERGAIWQNITVSLKMTNTAQKMKFFIKDFLSKCDQIRRLLRIWSHLLQKSLMENFIFCAVQLLEDHIESFEKVNVESKQIKRQSDVKTLHKNIKFSIKNFFSICDQIRSLLRIWSHLLKKSLMKNFIFCAVKTKKAKERFGETRKIKEQDQSVKLKGIV